MCRNIKTLFNFEPPATEAEIRAASVQFVSKLSGTARPSKANQAAFEQASDDINLTVTRLLQSLITGAEPRDRETETARARAEKRFGRPGPVGQTG